MGGAGGRRGGGSGAGRPPLRPEAVHRNWARMARTTFYPQIVLRTHNKKMPEGAQEAPGGLLGCGRIKNSSRNR